MIQLACTIWIGWPDTSKELPVDVKHISNTDTFSTLLMVLFPAKQDCCMNGSQRSLSQEDP